MKIKVNVKRDAENRFIPHLKLKDGFEMSVQGSEFNYSHPREMTDRYEEMEIGFPTMEEPLLMEYAEDKDQPTQTVYGYVPADVIAKVIEKHGGIDGPEVISYE
jgi:hypothetical protein